MIVVKLVNFIASTVVIAVCFFYGVIALGERLRVIRLRWQCKRRTIRQLMAATSEVERIHIFANACHTYLFPDGE